MDSGRFFEQDLGGNMEKPTAGQRVIVLDGVHEGRTGEIEGSSDTGGNVRVIFDVLSKRKNEGPGVPAWINSSLLQKIEGGKA